MDYSNKTKEKIKSKKPVLTAMVRLANPMLAEIIAKCGAESITIDNEHFPFTDNDIVNLIRAIHGAGAEAMVRVNQKDTGTIYRTLDMGADGILAPNVSGLEEAKTVISAAKYPPEGNRGCCPITRGADFGMGVDVHEYYQKINDKIQVSLMIEDHQVLDQVDDILKLKGIDQFAIGPSDFSGSYGRPGRASDPDIKKDMADTYAKITAAGYPASGLSYTPDDAAKTLSEGKTVLNIGSDLQMLTKCFTKYVSMAEEAAKECGIERTNHTLKEKFNNKEFTIVPFIRIAEPAIAEMAILAGADAIIIDNEHYAFSDSELINMIRAAHSRGGKVIVRVYDKSKGAIGRVLDMGADGIMAPQVSSYEEALEIIDYVKFPPEGHRGFCPITPGADYGLHETPKEYAARKNKETIVGIMIETKAAYEDLDRILTLGDQVDYLTIGPSDLSASYGKPGHYDDPEVTAAIASIVEKTKDSNIALMTIAANKEAMKHDIQAGTRMMCPGSDIQYMIWGFTELVTEIKKRISEDK